MTPPALPNEGSRPFTAFKMYVEDGPKRSIRRCARKLRKSPTIIARWSKRYRWQKRLRELELEDAQRSVRAAETAALDAAKELEAERSEFRRRAIAASRRATERGLQILKQSAKGSKPSDAARLLAVADAIGRAALELKPTGVTGGLGWHSASVPNINVVIEQDEHSKKVKQNEDEFFARHPELKRPKNGLLENNGNGTAGLASD